MSWLCEDDIMTLSHSNESATWAICFTSSYLFNTLCYDFHAPLLQGIKGNEIIFKKKTFVEIMINFYWFNISCVNLVLTSNIHLSSVLVQLRMSMDSNLQHTLQFFFISWCAGNLLYFFSFNGISSLMVYCVITLNCKDVIVYHYEVKDSLFWLKSSKLRELDH